MLRVEFADLDAQGFDLSLTGFEGFEISPEEIDYSVLDGGSIDDKLDDMAAEVKKAIQIEFEAEHYNEAQDLVKFWRNEGAYIGMMIINHLRDQKDKL